MHLDLRKFRYLNWKQDSYKILSKKSINAEKSSLPNEKINAQNCHENSVNAKKNLNGPKNRKNIIFLQKKKMKVVRCGI